MHDNPALVRGPDRPVRGRTTCARPSTATASALDLRRWEVPGEPVPFADAVGQAFEPFAPGSAVGQAVGHHLVPRHRHRPATAWPAPRRRGRARRRPRLPLRAARASRPRDWSSARTGATIKAIEPFNHSVPRRRAGPAERSTSTSRPPPTRMSASDFELPARRRRRQGDRRHRARSTGCAGSTSRCATSTVWELLQDLWTLAG